MSEHAVVLNIQETTELDFNGGQSKGLESLNYEAERGMYLYPTYASITSLEPRRVLDAWMWSRESKAADGKRAGIEDQLPHAALAPALMARVHDAEIAKALKQVSLGNACTVAIERVIYKQSVVFCGSFWLSCHAWQHILNPCLLEITEGISLGHSRGYEGAVADHQPSRGID